MTASGTFSQWPAKAWVDRAGIEISPANEKGKLLIKVAPDAAPGVYWLRLYDDEGATSPRPFIVGTLPEIIETEPNDDPKKPQVLESASVVVNGQLAKGNDVDTFAVQLHQGQTLVASMEANRTLGSPMDATLQIVSADGFVLEQNDEYHDFDPQIVFTVPADGTYLVRTFAFPAVATGTIGFAGGGDFIYRLTITTGGFVEYAYPLALSRAEPGLVELVGWNLPDAAKKLAVQPEPGTETATLFLTEIANTAPVRIEPHAMAVEQEPNDAQHPQEIQLPVTISGRIDPARDVDVYGFKARKGDKLLFQIESRALGFPLDPLLRLSDATGKIVSEVDDSRGGRDAELPFTVPADGEYRIVVRDLHGHGGFRYVYRLRAVFAEPDFALTLAADSLAITPGKPLEVPVTIERLNGFAGEIEITATGLPDGVSIAAAKSAGTGDSAKSVKLVLTATAGPAAGPIRIVGNSASDPKLSRIARAAIAGLSESTADVWLTVAKSSEDKK